MERLPVTSDTVKAIGYDPASQRCEVEFKNGHCYTYHGVAETHYRDLLSAPSIGAHLNKVFKPRYKGHKI